jgi:hypothetical protein
MVSYDIISHYCFSSLLYCFSSLLSWTFVAADAPPDDDEDDDDDDDDVDGLTSLLFASPTFNDLIAFAASCNSLSVISLVANNKYLLEYQLYVLSHSNVNVPFFSHLKLPWHGILSVLTYK